jgi:hypothetical protein
VTGGNGCGKSTLFELIGTCSALGHSSSSDGGTARAAAPQLHPSVQLLALEQLSLPSADVVEVTQDFYCPLFTKPIEWLVQSLSQPVPLLPPMSEGCSADGGLAGGGVGRAQLGGQESGGGGAR